MKEAFITSWDAYSKYAWGESLIVPDDFFLAD